MLTDKTTIALRVAVQCIKVTYSKSVIVNILEKGPFVQHFIEKLLNMGKGKTRPHTPLHALARPHTPSHALSSPRPKTTRPLPAVDQVADPSTYTKLAEGVFYPRSASTKRLRVWVTPCVNHALGANCYPRLRALAANFYLALC